MEEHLSKIAPNVNTTVKTWLKVCALMCILMISIGGYTRLSKAGLSIVEWNLVRGTIPPLSQEAWEIEFNKYKSSPEYKLVNFHISMNEFKKIFLIEFVHRLVGRVFGVIILIPLIIFYYNKTLSISKQKWYLLFPLIASIQGLIGWYMVKSGITKDPHVNHFMLALHLFVAMILYVSILSTLYKPLKITNLRIFILLTLCTQIILGGLVAGLNAGMIYNTFPTMNGAWIPDEASFVRFNTALYSPGFVQFLHRNCAYIVGILYIYYGVIEYFKNKNKLGLYLIIIVILQIIFGIITLVGLVPMCIALTHQIFAFILLSVTVASFRRINY